MKILLCCPLILDKKYGGAKVYMEMAEAYRRIGHDCTIVSPNDLSEGMITELSFEDKFKKYPKALKNYLKDNAAQYDVVEYEHEFLPFERELFPKNTLMVARSVLLVQHLNAIVIPERKNFLRLVKNILYGNKRSKFVQKRINMANETIKNADIANVTNPDDKKQLIAEGHESHKIFDFPYGISKERLNDFFETSTEPPEKNIVAFVGSFDYRKGALEFPQIVHEVINKVSDVEFLLLGTKGLFPDEVSVLNFFPKRYHSQIKIIPQFDPQKLPEYLKSVSVGMFPSHLESFGFGVLEMLAAKVPVVAYDVPGPPLMLESNMLVGAGNGFKMAERIIQLLEDKTLLKEERIKASQTAHKETFDWDTIAQNTINTYQQLIQKR